MNKPFQQFGKQGKQHDLSTFAAFYQTIDSFSPGAEIVFPLAQGAKLFSQTEKQSQLPLTFSLTAEYDVGSLRVTETNQIDFRPYLNAGIPQDAYVRKLESIRKALEIIAHAKNSS